VKFTREMLFRAFNGDARMVAAFEAQTQTVQDNADAVGTGTEATTNIQNATVVTLSANDVFENERILLVGPGLAIDDNGSNVVIRIADDGVTTTGGFSVNMSAQGVTNVVMPISGTISTLAGGETLSNKTLDAPSLANLGNYANDGAASSGGVPIGGMYRNGSALMVRVS